MSYLKYKADIRMILMRKILSQLDRYENVELDL